MWRLVRALDAYRAARWSERARGLCIGCVPAMRPELMRRGALPAPRLAGWRRGFGAVARDARALHHLCKSLSCAYVGCLTLVGG